jgi:prolipoprotein diacylglyceryltransferase
MPDVWGLFSATGGVTAVLWLQRHRRGLGVSENEFWAALWTLLVGAVVGAKALFLVLGWEHYARGELRLWADFGVGFVFFGGLVGAAAAGALFARLRGLSFTAGADYFAVAIPIGHAIGRIGCFLAGCCPGRPPHPVQLYESLGLALIALTCRAVLGGVEAEALRPGAAFRCYLVLYGVLRFPARPAARGRAPGALSRAVASTGDRVARDRARPRLAAHRLSRARPSGALTVSVAASRRLAASGTCRSPPPGRAPPAAG